MVQQTAVEWFHKKTWELKMLLEKQQISVGEYGVAYYDIFEQAKQMEREQIESAFFKGHCDGYNAGVSLYSEVEFQSSDQYYTQTYGNNQTK